MSEIPCENILEVIITDKQYESHDTVLTCIQKQQEEAPIRQVNCAIYQQEEFGIEHPLFSVLQSMTTLEYVEIISENGTVFINAFINAISQNDSIRTVVLHYIHFSAFALQKLLE